MTEKSFIEVENGEKVAVLHEDAGSDRWLFVCHGFGGNKDRQSEYIEPAVENGFNPVILDFRGNGESSGEFIDQDLSSRIKDLKAVIKHFDPERYVLFGTSFGGKVALHAAPELEPEAVIGKAPVTYNRIMDKFRAAVEEKGEFEYIDGKPIDQRFFDDLDSQPFEAVVGEIDAPVAIFHGGADTTVHPEHSLKTVKNLEGETLFHRLEGEEHSFTEKGKERMLSLMFDWLSPQ
ncbi:MAG: alpha/beta hydrolase family protein [Candidatus Nanohaloarchaea archaeon]